VISKLDGALSGRLEMGFQHLRTCGHASGTLGLCVQKQARLIVVRRHPGEQDEGAPVVAEVADDERPHGRLGQQQPPGDLLRRFLRARARHPASSASAISTHPPRTQA
jgi:hypothetical protein